MISRLTTCLYKHPKNLLDLNNIDNMWMIGFVLEYEIYIFIKDDLSCSRKKGSESIVDILFGKTGSE